MATPAIHVAGAVGDATVELRKQAAVATLSVEALSGASLERLMQHAVEVSTSVLGGDAAAICELQPATGRLDVRTRHGLELSDGLSCPADATTAFGRCLMTGQPVLVSDWQAERRFDCPAALAAAGIRSSLAVHAPAGEWTGVLSVHAQRPDAFAAESVRMLGELAGVLRAGVRRAALERLLCARSDQHAALAALGRLALSDIPLQQVLDEAAGLVGHAVGADLVTVSSRQPDGLPLLEGSHPPGLAAAPSSLDDTAARRGLVADWAAVGGAPQSLAEQSLRCSVMAGMGPHGRHGTLAVHSRQADRFGWAEARMVEACASVLATAIERAHTERRGAHHPEAAAAMLQADAEERARIAGELHDDTVQEMAAILITLDRVVNAARRGDTDTVVTTAVKARETLAAATEHARRLLFELRPPLLDTGGLCAALRGIAARSELADDVDVSVSGGDVDRHPQPLEALVYRTMGELISAARARPGVTRVAVELDQVGGHLVGLVEDDAPGDHAGPADQLPLAALVERIRLAGGRLDIGRSAAGGTARLRVPLSPIG